MAEDTFTTEIQEEKDGVTIYTIHDQTGSVANGFVPLENIDALIEKLKHVVSADYSKGECVLR